MKTAKAESKKIHSNKINKTVKLRRVAGVQVRSGVKAGGRREFMEKWREHD